MTVVSGAGLGARESGFRQAAALAFRGGQAPDKPSEAHFHRTQRIARAGSIDTEGQANGRAIIRRKACGKRMAARKIPQLTV
jgi:hypothetical protein